MKSIFTFLLVTVTVTAFAQKKVPIYGKINPIGLVSKDDPLTPGGLLGVGIRAGKWATVGLAGGYFKLSGDPNGVAPIGFDVTFTNYKTKKPFPAVSAQIMYPFHKSGTPIASQGGIRYENEKQNGTAMLNLHAGIALPFTETKKLIVSAGYSALIMKVYPENQNDTKSMFLISLAVIL